MKTNHSTVLMGLALLMLAFASCKKSPETIGNNLISDDDYIAIYHTDTTRIICHSYLDSVATNNASYALLGAMHDPVLGKSEAGFYTQFRPSVAGQSFGSNPVVDSLVLQLYLVGYYGDTTTMQTAHVYQLGDTLSYDATYYNCTTMNTDGVDYANGYQFSPRPKTKVHVIGTDTIAQPIVRIPLSLELGNQLVNIDTTAYSRPDLFKQHFKGLYVTCAPVGVNGAISSISLTNNTYTLLQLYYHNAATPEKPMRYNYYVTTSDTYFNHIDHDYTQGAPEFVGQLLDGNEDLGQQKLYLQTMGGVRAKVLFPNLSHWADSLEGCHLVINEARLILPATSEVDSVYKAPSNFMLIGFSSDTTTYLLSDYLEGSAFFDGTYHTKDQAAVFRVTEYMQSIIMNKRENLGLSLGINGAAYNASRYVINGPEALNGEKMRLEVTYSIVNE